MSHIDVFRPTNGEIVMKSDLASGLGQSYDVFKKSVSRPSTQGGSRFGKLSQNSFFARHNPHPVRVRHLKGLLDVPICSVSDDLSVSNPRYSSQWPPNNHDQSKLNAYSRYYNIPANAINVNTQSHPINTITGLQYFLGKPLNFRIYSEKIQPRSGIANVNEAWKNELLAFTNALGLDQPQEPKREERKTPMTGRPRTQYSETTGRLIPPPSRAMSRGFSRSSQRREQFMNTMADQFNLDIPNPEETVMTLLAQILQTDDINAVQQWLIAAGDREKNLVMDMLKAALSSQEQYYQQQPKEVVDYFEKRERERPITGTLGDEDDPLKKIDRLTLEPSSPRPMTAQSPAPMLPPIGHGDEQVRPPTSDAFRPNTGRRSARPGSRLATPKTPLRAMTPAKLKYTSNNDNADFDMQKEADLSNNNTNVTYTWNQENSTVN